MQRCITHGWVHYPGETDDVALVGDELDCRTETIDVVPGEVLSSQCERAEVDAGFFIVQPDQLAYLDTFGGMVPVKVLSISNTEAEVKVTAARPGFTRGERVELRIPNVGLVTRTQVYRKRGRLVVAGPTRFYTDEGVLV